MIKLTFQRDPAEAISFRLPLWWSVCGVFPGCQALLPQSSVLSELSVSAKLGSNRFASVFWDIKGREKMKRGGGSRIIQMFLWLFAAC